MRKAKKIILRTGLYLAFAFICLVLILPLLITPLINAPVVKEKIIHAVRTRTGVSLAPDTLKLALFPAPAVYLTALDLGGQARLTAKKAVILLDLPLLLQRQIAVRRIEIDTPALTIACQDTQGKSAGTRFPELSLSRLDQTMDRLFALMPESQVSLQLEIQNAKTDYVAAMDSRLTLSRPDKSLVIFARAKGMDTQNLPSWAGPFLDSAGISSLRLDTLSLRARVQGTGPDRSLSGSLKTGAITAQARQIPHRPLGALGVDIRFQWAGDRLSVRSAPVSITYPHARVGVEFSLQDKAVTLLFKGEDIDISQAREVCLPLLKGVHTAEILFDILRKGRAEKIDVGFQAPDLASLFDGRNLILKGNALDATVKIPQVPILARHVFGQATMAKGMLSIAADKGEVSTTKIRKGRLDIDLVNHKNEPFTGRFHLAPQLAELPELLISLLPETELARELSRITHLTGTADAVLDLAMAPDRDDLDVKVNATGIQAQGRYDRLMFPIVIDSGRFRYGQDQVTLDGFSGRIGKSRVPALNAEVELSDSLAMDLHDSSAMVHLPQLKQWLDAEGLTPQLLVPAASLEGRLIFDRICVRGPMLSPGRWQYDVTGSGRSIAVGTGKTAGDVRDIHGRFRALNRQLEISRLNARLNSLTWAENYTNTPHLSDIQTPIILSQGAFSDLPDSTVFKGSLRFPLGPEAVFELTGKDLGTLFPTQVILKDPDRSDVVITPFKSPDKPMLDLKGCLNSDSLKKLLVEGSPLYLRLHALAADDAVSIRTDPAGHLYVETGHLNLDTLLSSEKKRDKPARTPGRPLMAQKKLFFKASHLTYRGRHLTDLDARISFSPEKTQISIQNAGLCNLTALGNIEISHAPLGNQVSTDLGIKVDQEKNIADLLACLFKTESLIEGPYTFSARLKGQAPADKIGDQQNGELEFRSQSGRIYKATLLSRVLSVLNILEKTDIHQQGFGYNRIVIDAEIKESVIHLTRAYIDGLDMAIIGSGSLSPLTDSLDLTILVAPLKTVDTIIKHIPVVNTILSGRLVSFPAKATGKISDPQVIPMHPSAVGQGLINLFTDLIKAPVRLIQGNESQP